MLPGEFGSVDEEHFDTLTGYAAPPSAVAVLTTEETAIRVKLVGDLLLKKKKSAGSEMAHTCRTEHARGHSQTRGSALGRPGHTVAMPPLAPPHLTI